MSWPVPIGAPARHHAHATATPDPGRRRPPRYLWCGLLLVPVLIDGGLHLTSTFTHIGIAVYRDRAGTVWLTRDFSN